MSALLATLGSSLSVRSTVTRRHKSMCCYVPSLKMGRMIHCESMLEGDAVGVFDHSEDVLVFLEQPCTEYVYADGKHFKYTPDFLLTLVNGSEEFVEVKLSKSLRSAKLKRRLNQVALHFQKSGRRFSVMTELEIRKKGYQRNLRLRTYHARALTKDFAYATNIQFLGALKNLTYDSAVAVMRDQKNVLRLVSRGCLSYEPSQPLTPETSLQFVSMEVRHAAFQV